MPHVRAAGKRTTDFSRGYKKTRFELTFQIDPTMPGPGTSVQVAGHGAGLRSVAFMVAGAPVMDALLTCVLTATPFMGAADMCAVYGCNAGMYADNGAIDGGDVIYADNGAIDGGGARAPIERR